VVASAAIGALLVAAATSMRPRSVPAVALGAGAFVVAVISLSLAAGGLVERHAGVDSSTALGKDVVAWLSRQPGFADGDEPVAIASRAMIAPVAGDRLQHRVELIPAREDCSRVRALARRGWVVTSQPSFARSFLGIEPVTSPLCMRGEQPLFRGKNFDVYRVR
jgi:hypothetical protein